MRPSIRFQAMIDETLGVQADGSIGTEPAWFELWRSPTGRERHEITLVTHKIMGDGDEAEGIRKLADLRKAISQQDEIIRSEIEEKCPNDVDDNTREQLIREAWKDHSSQAVFVKTDLMEQVGGYRLFARWNVLAKDVPEAFKQIEDVALEDAAWEAIQLAWWKASEEFERGKA